MYKKEDLILLNMAGVGKKTLEQISKKDLSKKLSDKENQENLKTELSLIKKHGVEVITFFESSYPKILKQIHCPPLVLYVKGSMLRNEEFAVGIVGSRLASVYGITTAEKLGYELASNGVVIVSGLARGIDSAAHRGVGRAHGRTIAVLGNGLKTVYPPENKKLADEIIDKGGAVISEFPMAMPPLARNFPRRNRIISGLSLAIVVAEASKNSGALITADFALEQGKEVFAIPGKIDSATSIGTNELIKQGARLIQGAEDIMQELGLNLNISAPKSKNKKDSPKPELSAEESVLYESLSNKARHLDEICENTRFSISKSAGLLFKLQLKKLVKELPGKNFIKVG